jgi:hypothetical protein
MTDRSNGGCFFGTSAIFYDAACAMNFHFITIAKVFSGGWVPPNPLFSDSRLSSVICHLA